MKNILGVILIELPWRGSALTESSCLSFYVVKNTKQMCYHFFETLKYKLLIQDKK